MSDAISDLEEARKAREERERKNRAAMYAFDLQQELQTRPPWARVLLPDGEPVTGFQVEMRNGEWAIILLSET